MANITDIAPQGAWDNALSNNLIRKGANDSGSVNIYNYVTANVQFKKLWDDITMASRGLVVDAATGEILARPFGKFFGWSEYSPEDQAKFLNRNEKIQVTDKLDGSLGILYTDPATGDAAIATRGSLTGKHAVMATEFYCDNFDGKWSPENGYTYLFEILMPGAGIVIHYPKDDLVLIGKINNETGVSVPLDEVPEWKWERAEILNYSSLSEAIAAPARPYKEGMVVHFLDTNERVKIKYDEFVRLHRIGSGVSKYRVWEALSNGVIMDEWKPFLEEEFYSFVDEVAGELNAKYEAKVAEAREAYRITKDKFGDSYERKDFAKFVNSEFSKPIASYVLNTEFNAKNGPHENRLWETVKPEKDIK